MVEFNLNGKNIKVDVDPNTPLLWVLREHLNLTGTKFGCGLGLCGACTVLLEGEPLRSCSFPAVAAIGKHVVTIEGLEQDGVLSKLQQAWIDNQVPQCGYCQSGMIMAATALIQDIPKPTDDDINSAMSNICRCGTFQQIRAAIHAATKE